jgi:hypothetical protein
VESRDADGHPVDGDDDRGPHWTHRHAASGRARPLRRRLRLEKRGDHARALRSRDECVHPRRCSAGWRSPARRLE